MSIDRVEMGPSQSPSVDAGGEAVQPGPFSIREALTYTVAGSVFTFIGVEAWSAFPVIVHQLDVPSTNALINESRAQALRQLPEITKAVAVFSAVFGVVLGISAEVDRNDNLAP